PTPPPRPLLSTFPYPTLFRSSDGWLARIIKPLSLRLVTITLFALAVMAYGASAFLSMPRGYHEVLFAGIIGSLGWLMLAFLNRRARKSTRLKSSHQII